MKPNKHKHYAETNVLQYEFYFAQDPIIVRALAIAAVVDGATDEELEAIGTPASLPFARASVRKQQELNGVDACNAIRHIAHARMTKETMEGER